MSRTLPLFVKKKYLHIIIFLGELRFQEMVWELAENKQIFKSRGKYGKLRNRPEKKIPMTRE